VVIGADTVENDYFSLLALEPIDRVDRDVSRSALKRLFLVLELRNKFALLTLVRCDQTDLIFEF
jgi:hypothetical protein